MKTQLVKQVRDLAILTHHMTQVNKHLKKRILRKRQTDRYVSLAKLFVSLPTVFIRDGGWGMIIENTIKHLFQHNFCHLVEISLKINILINMNST